MPSHLTLHRLVRPMVGLALGAVMACPTWSAAQTPPAITADPTMGTDVGPPVGNAYTISGGTLRPGPSGTNLFHSFSRFNVPSLGSATFNGPPDTANVVSRVTGMEASMIDGLISTRGGEFPMWTANFFLINPNGVMFGSNAMLDVGGAFRVSTADRIIFPDGVFSASLAGETVLSSEPPQAFGFLSSNPASITLNGASLSVDPGQTLSLVGGNIQISGGSLSAQGGLIQIGSVASPGNADLSVPDLGLGSFPLLGEVHISEFAFISVGTDFILPGGSVVIRSGQLTIDSSLLLTDTFDAGAPLGIDLRATESIDVRNGALIQTLSFGDGDASGISIATRNLAVTNGAVIESVALGAGRTGGIDIEIGRAEILNGTIRTTSSASIAGNIAIAATETVTLSGPTSEISTGTFSGVLAGNISLTAGNVILSDQARIRSGSSFEQAGESLSITASGSVSISGLAGISSQAFAQTAGAVDISASQLIMDAGFINTSTLGAGDAGRILVNASTVGLTNGAQMASSSQIAASGAGGSIAINAPGSVTISGVGPDDGVGSITFTGSSSSGIFSTASGTGNAGQIAVSTPALTLSDGARISVATDGAGNAGTILADGGNFTLTGGARIDSSTTGDGAGGSINLNAASQVSILNGGSVTADSLGAGLTGNITITAGDQIVMTNGSISTRAATSDGGNIALLAPNIIRLTDSQITTSVESGTGGGGNILIDPQVVILTNSTITANAFGGPGGSITIITPAFVADSLTQIQASSALSTPGEIDVPQTDIAGSIAQLPKELVDASRLLQPGCSARRAGAPSSFTVAGRGGVPVDADGYLPSSSAMGVPLVRAAAAARQREYGVALAMTDYRDCIGIR